jgi:RNA polymerase sigma-70 factor (ECF subfamily)
MDGTPSTRMSLLVRLRDPRDGRAWGEFLAIYTPLIRRLARRRGLQDADAADLAQEVFRAVAAAIERQDYDPARGSFRGWLFCIARNRIVNFLARRDRHPRGTGDSDVKAFLEAQPAPAEEDAFEAEYRRQLLDWAAGQVRGEFSELTWQAFWKAGVEGLPAREVADALGTTVGNVYHSKSRVMARLRQKIEEVEGGDEPPGESPP